MGRDLAASMEDTIICSRYMSEGLGISSIIWEKTRWAAVAGVSEVWTGRRHRCPAIPARGVRTAVSNASLGVARRVLALGPSTAESMFCQTLQLRIVEGFASIQALD